MVQKPCPFCSYGARAFSAALVVYQDPDVLVVPCLAQKPRNHGHCVVFPRAHVPNLYELPDALAAPVLRAVSITARAIKKAFHADGVSVRQNNDEAGGQDVFHLHFHVVPRFRNDDFDTARYERLDELTRVGLAEVLRRAWPA